jgi:hypothetical protein
VKFIVFAICLGASSASAAEAPKECQTEESLRYRYTAEGMNQAATEAMPNGFCSISCPTELYNSMEVKQWEFRSEASAALAMSRAIEAAKCPQWADKIMAGVGVPSPEQQSRVEANFRDRMDKERARFAALMGWQDKHPQCKHVQWMMSGGVITNGLPDPRDYSSKDDFSGNYDGKAGYCAANGHGEAWRGTEDDMKMENPATNDLIAKVACANALRDEKLFDGSYADPKLCSPDS